MVNSLSDLFLPIAHAAEQKIPIGSQVANFYEWALAISAIVALAIIVYAGIAYIVSGGNASRQADAKQWIWNALIGLALLFGSYLILNTINPDLLKLQNIDLSQVKIEPAPPQADKNLDLAQLIGNFYEWALGIGGIVALAIIIFAGILYTISPGNSSRQNNAKTWIGSAIVGLVLLFGSYAILNTVNPELTKLPSLKSLLEESQLAAPVSAPAAEGEPPKPGEKVPLGIAGQISNLYQWALGIGGLIALAVLIFGGILYIISSGNTSRQDEAKSWLLGAVMGILLLFGSYLILNTVNPELTKLKDLELIVNEAAQPGSFSGIPNVDISNSGPNCDGFYTRGTVKAYYGNFGDPLCEYANEATRAQYKDKLFQYLQMRDSTRGNAEHWFNVVIPHETVPAGYYNPNAVNPKSTCTGFGGAKKTCELGACGLYQTDCECKNIPDCGGVNWQAQTDYAVDILKSGRSNYWPYDWYRNLP